MNIYSKKGSHVIVTKESAHNGYDYDKEQVKRLLEINKVYTVRETIVSNWHTDVILKEFPDEKFNSVNFLNCTKKGIIKETKQ